MTQRKEIIENILSNFQSIGRIFAAEGKDMNKRLGITMSQMNLIFIIVHEGKMTVTEIANKLGVSKSAATQLIDSLVQQGCVIRINDTVDRRVFFVQLSEKSRKHMAAMRERNMSRMATLFDTLSRDELAQFERITKKLMVDNTEENCDKAF